MFARGVVVAFGSQHVEAVADYLTCFVWMNNVIDVAELGNFEWVGKEVAVVLDIFCAGGVRVVGRGEFFTVDNVHRAFGSHDGNFAGWVDVVEVTAEMFGRHHVVGAAVRFAGDYGHFGYGRFGVGVEEFGAVSDDTAILLAGAGQEAGYVDQGDDRDVECVAEANEARGLC